MSVYLDASVLVALMTNDPLSDQADALLRESAQVLAVSDFAGAEFAAAIARRVRMEEMTPDEARSTFADLDAWIARGVQRCEAGAADIAAATAFIRRLDLTLRAPDALNIAIALRLGSELATLDAKMASSARALGVAVLSPPRQA